jgi:hypothetical protein
MNLDEIDKNLVELNRKYGTLEVQRPWYYEINNEVQVRPKSDRSGEKPCLPQSN